MQRNSYDSKASRRYFELQYNWNKGRTVLPFLDVIEIVENVLGMATALSTSDNIEQFSTSIVASFCR